MGEIQISSKGFELEDVPTHWENAGSFVGDRSLSSMTWRVQSYGGRHGRFSSGAFENQ